MKEHQPGYAITKIYEDTYAIEDFSIRQGSVFMYLLVGSEKALLIDSGYGLLNLPELVHSITDKPVICACTHGHLDHALGACQFDEAYLHSADFDVYARHTAPDFLKLIGSEGILTRPSQKNLKDTGYHAMIETWMGLDFQPLKPIESIEYFELGNRAVFWHHIPGHTQGSIAFFDEKYRTVFDADAAPSGVWLFLEESSALQNYLQILETYRSYLHQNAVKSRYTGHSAKPATENDIEKLIACVNVAYRKPKKGYKFTTNLGKARLVIACGTAAICKI